MHDLAGLPSDADRAHTNARRMWRRWETRFSPLDPGAHAQARGTRCENTDSEFGDWPSRTCHPPSSSAEVPRSIRPLPVTSQWNRRRSGIMMSSTYAWCTGCRRCPLQIRSPDTITDPKYAYLAYSRKCSSRLLFKMNRHWLWSPTIGPTLVGNLSHTYARVGASPGDVRMSPDKITEGDASSITRISVWISLRSPQGRRNRAAGRRVFCVRGDKRQRRQGQ
ncbi:hypothetical protein FKP32DRAFT_1104250 [Trametes sanguinea]|nr:hypothetical protein FKP32DRAFT_1104250 [Trametes sanguinea]